MADTQIVPLILDTLQAWLTTKLITNVSDVNEKAKVVEVGRFQADPTVDNIYVAIQGGYIEKPNYMDGIVTLEELHRIGIYVPAREVGGSGQQMWWRRGTCEIGCYYIGSSLSEAVARQSAYNVLGRLSSNIENVGISDLTDDFGESGVQMFLYASEFHQGGGPPADFIWRGRVLWQALTERVAI